jgi:hypothetical protein
MKYEVLRLTTDANEEKLLVDGEHRFSLKREFCLGRRRDDHTVAVRGCWICYRVADGVAVDRDQYLNEIIERVSLGLCDEEHDVNRRETLELIEFWANQSKKLER